MRDALQRRMEDTRTSSGAPRMGTVDERYQFNYVEMANGNPTDDAHDVYLYEKPLGGSVRSSFVVDGRLKEVDCVRVPQPYAIATYQLAPHSTGATTTVTMTDGGSSYPLEFGVTETQPLPAAPPLGAPDGCSPDDVPSPEPAAEERSAPS